MKVASFFTGIGGLDLGLEKAGHQIVFQCEIDKFCQKVLKHHWPNVLFHENILEITNAKTIPTADIWCGGFPCQDVSLARARPRDGLRGSRSGLFYKFAELLSETRPNIVIIENVPGLLSSNKGEDFQVVIQTLAEIGYAVGWRVFNSQYFGVPQSRSRVYIIGHLGGPARIGQILFESERSTGQLKKSSESRQKFISPLKESLRDDDTGATVQRISYCLAATSGRHTGTDWSRSYVCYPNAVRRFTPKEYERIQGFPDNWTLPPILFTNGELSEDFDTPRYTALGNAVTVSVAEWLGNQITKSEFQEVRTLSPQRINGNVHS